MIGSASHATLDAFLRDVRYAARGLRRSPLFTVVAVLTLAIGTGATTAVFSVVDGVLLKPLPYKDPDRLIAVSHDAPGMPGLAAVGGGLQMSLSMFVTYREQNRSFESIGLWAPTGANVTGFAEPENLPAVLVSGRLLETLGVPPLLGRWLNEGDEAPGGPAVGMLAYDYWQRRFGGDPSVVGRNINVNSIPTEIVGVMPKGFRFGEFRADVIGPVVFDRSQLWPGGFNFNAVARLEPGATIEHASADIGRMLPMWVEMFPFRGGPSTGGQTAAEVYLDTWKIAPALRPLKAYVIGSVGNLLWVVLGTIAVVLVIACANVTNLLLVRGEQRAQEIAVRSALGAGAWRLSRALLIESVLLALAGGVVGIVIAYGALAVFLRLAPALPRLDAIALDWRAVAFTLAVTVACGFLLGLVPALRAAHARLSTALRSGGRGSSGGRDRHRVQNALVVGQVALTLVLLVSSGLMIRTFEALRSVDPGFSEPATLQLVRITHVPQLVPDAADVFHQQRAMLDAVAALPGVESVALATNTPLEELGGGWDVIDVEGRPGPISSALRTFRFTSPGFFKTMGTPIVAGRDFEWGDLEALRPVALVSENLARELWQEPEAAVGRQIRASGGGPWREIVGVAGDVRNNNLADAPPTIVYWPSFMTNLYGPGLAAQRFVTVVVRSERAGTAALARELERAVWSVNSSVPLSLFRTLQERYDNALARTSFTLVMLAAAGGAALVLGIVGLYGVISYAVSQRRREIAVRLALGAQQSRVTRTFVRHGAWLAVIGIAIGLVAATAVTRLMSTLLYDVRAFDPLTYAAVAVMLTLAAALASYMPARKAASVDPAEALVAE
jgi:predicted permease